MSDKKQATEVSNFSILKSAMAAMVGIQTDANRERDFKSGKFWHFFIAGAIVTVAFIATVWVAVQYLLNSV